jgi:hypothetical protein
MIAAEREHEQAVLQIADRPIGGPRFSLNLEHVRAAAAVAGKVL